MAVDWGLNSDELIWTSEYKDEWQAEISHEDVLALFRLSNVFIMASRSESYSLITQEAAMNKVVVVLNQDFPPFRDIFGPNAIYRKYSSNFDVMADPKEAVGSGKFTNTEYGPSGISPEERKMHEINYHKETAGMIAARLRSEQSQAMSSFLKKFRNLDYIWKHELEPLLYEN
jgi:glycosyltransferase involved in cell wall biosynthesis